MPLQIAPYAGPFRDSETYVDPNIDTELSSREFDGSFAALSADDAALSLLQGAIHRLQEAHWCGDQSDSEAVRAKSLSYAVQAIAGAARLPLEARIAALETRLDVLEARAQ